MPAGWPLPTNIQSLRNLTDLESCSFSATDGEIGLVKDFYLAADRSPYPGSAEQINGMQGRDLLARVCSIRP